MPISCTANDLETGAASLGGTSERDLLAMQTYLLAVMAGVSLDPDVLLANAKDFQECSAEDLAAISAYLLCQIANL